MSPPAPGKPLTEVDRARLTASDASPPLLERLPRELRERYAIEREIGRGGGSHVFLGREPGTARPIAIKVLRPELALSPGEERFQREIGIVQSLSHPNILPLFEFGNLNGFLYFTMPFVEGSTLRSRIRRERQMKLGDAIAIARDVAAALDFAHGNGVVHRDIKPANILLDGERTLVADFGIARAMIVASSDEITPSSGIAIGTVEYMSPEQGEGHRELDGRSDVYALGCVVYEMLAGEPPFTGATAQAIVARHCFEPPRSIRVIRPTIPIGVERAVERALAKVPADRFDSAMAFVDALEEGIGTRTDVFGLTRLTHRKRRAVTTVLASAVLGLGWYSTQLDPPVLDSNRIVVFPFTDLETSDVGAGEGVATYIGYALDGTRPLKWLDGWDLMVRDRGPAAARISADEARRLSRQARAAHYIDGAILRRPDSLTVIVRLHRAGTDSVVGVESRTAAASVASLPMLGLQAVAALLPALVAPGGTIDVRALSARAPSAVANFLQGEREYRRMRFNPALAYYDAALRDDSAFTLAALRGAYAATWLSRFETATARAELAMRNRQSLPLAQELLAKGLRSYLVGDADSATFYVRAALRSDPAVHAGWTLLGETVARLLPTGATGDSVARDALERARERDPGFAPTLLLLEELALRRGDVGELTGLRDALRRAEADTSHAESRALMHRCVLEGPAAVDWGAAVRHDENMVMFAGKILGAGAAQPGCAMAAFRALLETAGTGPNVRWASLLGAQSVLAALGRSADGALLFTWPGARDLPVGRAYLLLAAADMGYAREAARVADSAAADYRGARTNLLWFAALWETRQGGTERLRAISQELARRADSSRARRDRVIAAAVHARVPLLEGDTSLALARLSALVPSATRQGIAWEPWESLGPERLLLARLLASRGQCRRAGAVASLLDASEPLVYPLYLRASLELRARCADALGEQRRANQYRQRLDALTAGR